MIIVYCSEMEITYLENLLIKYGGSHINLRERSMDTNEYFSNSEEYYLNSLITKYT